MKEKTNIYVAGSSKNFPLPELLMRLLEKDGYNITHDWTTEVKGNYLEGKLNEVEKQEIAIADANAVMAADLMVIVYPGDFSEGCGLYTELGIAIGKNIKVILYAPYQQKDFVSKVFLYHPIVHSVVYSYEELLETLSKLEPEENKLREMKNVKGLLNNYLTGNIL